MRGLYSLKLCLTIFIFVNCNISEFVSCQNKTALNENIVATFYKYYYTIVKLSNNFHQFPMRDDFRKTIPSPEVSQSQYVFVCNFAYALQKRVHAINIFLSFKN